LDRLDEARAQGTISAADWTAARGYVHTRQGAPPVAPTGEEMTARREHVRRRQLLLAIDQYGPGYQRLTGDGVRYAAEIVNATREEWDWMADHVRANPHLLRGEARSEPELYEHNRQAARDAYTAATAAIKVGDVRTALDRLDDAEVHHPTGHPHKGRTWDHYRTIALRRAAGTTVRTGDDPETPSHPVALARVNLPEPVTDPAGGGRPAPAVAGPTGVEPRRQRGR
jgi:hypothetical protein